MSAIQNQILCEAWKDIFKESYYLNLKEKDFLPVVIEFQVELIRFE